MFSGNAKLAEVGIPPSPQAEVIGTHDLPLPATVLMFPVIAFTSRITMLFESAMYMLPLPSNAMELGPFNEAAVAGPVSPVQIGGFGGVWGAHEPVLPLPAYVEIVAVLLVGFVTLRIRLLP